MNVRFLHSKPQHEVASLIRRYLTGCQSAKIISGFATPDGLDALRAGSAASRIDRLILGAGTFKAFEALDEMIRAGLTPSAARVHLGHTRATGGRRHPFARYRPMLHSKIYYFEMPRGEAAAFVGSHNLTGFALRGLNGEAGVLLEGPVTDPIFDEIRSHISASSRQAVPYDPSLKEAYARWLRDYLEQLGVDATDMPRDADNRRTIILFAEGPAGQQPVLAERLYFEIDKRIEEVKAIDTQVHLHIFATMPFSPQAALASSSRSDRAFLLRVEAIDATAGSAEIKADWHIEDPLNPVLRRTPVPFRPSLRQGNQQVRALIVEPLQDAYDYLFDAEATKWEPILEGEILIDEEMDQAWSAVAGFRQEVPLKGAELSMRANLLEASPESGSFILFSKRRRALGQRD